MNDTDCALAGVAVEPGAGAMARFIHEYIFYVPSCRTAIFTLFQVVRMRLGKSHIAGSSIGFRRGMVNGANRFGQGDSLGVSKGRWSRERGLGRGKTHGGQSARGGAGVCPVSGNGGPSGRFLSPRFCGRGGFRRRRPGFDGARTGARRKGRAILRYA